MIRAPFGEEYAAWLEARRPKPADTGAMPLSPSKLKARRESLGLTQQQVADAAGIHRAAYARIESGARTDPNLSTAQKVAKALRCKLETLLD